MSDHTLTHIPTIKTPERVCGTILLSYHDPDFRLHVTSTESHIVCAAHSPYDDGLHDFDAADYAAQRDALLRMLSVGKSCEMVFRVEVPPKRSEAPESLYFAKIYLDKNTCFAEIDPYYLDPHCGLNAYVDGLDLSKPERARKVYDLLFGGFLATEIDHMNNAWSHEDRMDEVSLFRRALEHARKPNGLLSIVTQETKRPLSTQIQTAQDRSTAEKAAMQAQALGVKPPRANKIDRRIYGEAETNERG